MIVTCWTDHVSATAPTAASRALEERLSVWWAELQLEWGWERKKTVEQGIFGSLTSPGRDDAPGVSPTNPKMFIQAQARNFAGPNDVPVSAAGYMPNDGRYPVLAPLRPRDSPVSFARSPSPRSVASDEERKRKREGGINLPPIQSEPLRDASREGTPRPLAPPPKRDRQWPEKNVLLGIDALVSAAEEHRRERLEQPSAFA